MVRGEKTDWCDSKTRRKRLELGFLLEREDEEKWIKNIQELIKHLRASFYLFAWLYPPHMSVGKDFLLLSQVQTRKNFFYFFPLP